ncbi:MAG TPA: MSMEG_0570 family nitrogen starvation response protein [Afipia sp.]
MPEIRFSIRWPDGKTELCYSPSLVIKDYLSVGQSYPLPDFLERTSQALRIASERVREKYGYSCSLALSQLAQIEAACKLYNDTPDASVRVNGFVE